MSNGLNQPKSFPKHWNVLPFLDVVKDDTGGNKKTKQSEAAETGRYPVIDQGQKSCCGYIDDADYLCKVSLPVILFGDHTKLIKFVNYPFALGADGVKVLSPKVELDKRFLFHFLKTLKLPEKAGYSRHYKFLKEAVIPLPPLAEQERIAAILDKADQLRQKRQQAIALADDFLRSVFLDMFGDPLANPKGWVVKSLGELTSLVTDGKHGDCKDEEGSGYYFLSAKNIRKSKLCLVGSREINYPEFAEVHRRTDLKPGDVLLVNTGATIGKVAIAPDSDYVYKSTLQKSVAVIKPKKELLNNQFLKQIILLKVDDFASKGSGSAIKNLLLSQIRDFPIILPPLAIQTKYCVIVNRVEAQSGVQEQSVKQSEKLFNALSQKAFAGDI
ncbi:restriction endonuclease subunit S [Endozoicomonas sp.]|uniref:restriction endonuclease subunit S n=1 Tax=Endozoicomonas sp. TaxID=1892382 RepID=UPI002887B8F4|nr:restriction endonuclease subunit S [Endozoicomonas sp.]